MTEEYEEVWSVCVRAQVMTRDEGTGGWVALSGGGLADVMLERTRVSPETEIDPTRALSHPPLYEYTIRGVRINDDTEVLSCTIKKDFQYHKVMPTFHHWVTGEKRFGLTFQTAADARAFDRGVRAAVEQLLHGLGGSWSKPVTGFRPDDEENNIFECLNLPSDSRSSSETSTASRPIRKQEDMIQTPILSAITLPSQASPRSADTSLKHYAMSSSGLDDDRGQAESNLDGSGYVHLTAVHEYTYPHMGSGVIASEKSSPSGKPALMRKDSGSIKKASDYPGMYTPPPLPDKKISQTQQMQYRIKCRHCSEWYVESANRIGSCAYAPDRLKSCIDAVTCIRCAQCLMYHTMADGDGDYTHPCSCYPMEARRDFRRRWIGITILSILVPCICCYPPLSRLHQCACDAHIAGSKHAPLNNWLDT